MYRIVQILVILFIIVIFVSVFLNIKYEKNLENNLEKQETIIKENIIEEEIINENTTNKNTNINQKDLVEKYIKDNINTLSTEQPVLGGTWYIVSIDINEQENIAKIVYEDGHIQNKANVKYLIENNTVSVIDFKKE